MAMDLEKLVLDMQYGNNDLFVAIWMVTYNHESYIAQAVESVMMQQTNFDYKLYIGEDCSADGTIEICKKLKEKYPKKIDLFLNAKNLGASQNAQQIYKACTESGAKYIAMLEGDDYWTDPLKLQKQVDFLEANPEFSMCFHNYYTKKEGLLKEAKPSPLEVLSLSDYIKSKAGIQTLTVLFRNDIKPIIPKELVKSVMGSYFVFIRLAEIGKLKYIDEPMAVYRVHSGGIWSGISSYEQGKMALKNKSAILSYFTNKKQIYHLVKDNYVEATLSYGTFFLRKFQLSKAFGFLYQSMKYGFCSVHLTYYVNAIIKKLAKA